MPRLRTNNVFGTTTDAPLLVGATTLNSAGLANLPVIASPNVAVLTLDPNRTSGAPEIVHVTAHTGSATSATILRGQEGTIARQHAAGTFWVHAATVVDWGTDWAAWTPTLTNLTLGNGTVIAKFARVGDTASFRFKFTLGSTSAVGTSPRFSLPAAQHGDYSTFHEIIGSATLSDTGTGTRFGIVDHVAAGEVVIHGFSSTGVLVGLSATVPHTWAATDVIAVTGTYQAA